MKRAKDSGGRAARVATFDFRGEGFAVVSHPCAADATDDALTAAEREVAELVVDGHSNADIARARRTSANTVGNQIASIFRKVGVSSRFELITRMRGTRGGRERQK